MKDFYGGQWILTENLQEKNGINYLKLGRSDELDFLFVAIYDTLNDIDFVFQIIVYTSLELHI